MSEFFDSVKEKVPQVHELVRTAKDFGPIKWHSAAYKSSFTKPAKFDFSRSNECGRLTLALFNLLKADGVPARREFHNHPFSNQWHFIVAQGNNDPTDQDTVVDLNPWNFASSSDKLPSYLIGPRKTVISEIKSSGSHCVRAECLEVSTIIASHTEEVGCETFIPDMQAMEAKSVEEVDYGFVDWRASS